MDYTCSHCGYIGKESEFTDSTCPACCKDIITGGVVDEAIPLTHHMPADTELLQARILGLETKLKQLRDAKDLFVKAQGLDEEAEKARKEVTDLEIDLQAMKEELSGLKGQKANALSATGEALSLKMSEVLPEGKALFEISEDGFFIGWEKPDGARAPYQGLSGGQEVMFNQALIYALTSGKGDKALLIEAAEMDDAKLEAALEHLAKLPEDTQVLLSTCHTPLMVPPQWKVIEVANAA